MLKILDRLARWWLNRRGLDGSDSEVNSIIARQLKEAGNFPTVAALVREYKRSREAYECLSRDYLLMHDWLCTELVGLSKSAKHDDTFKIGDDLAGFLCRKL